MTIYLLVHGAYQGAWCWHKIVPLLEAAGHRVLVPDLPGHGDDPAPASGVTLEAYVERIDGIMAAEPEPLVLIGHSMAGIVLSQVAERAPQRIARLAYLTAYLLRDGECISDIAKTDAGSKVVAERVEVDRAACVAITEEVLRAAFYHDAAPVDFAFARERARAQPLAPFRAPLALTEARYGRVPRVYIGCRDDRAISPATQAAMVAATPCAAVYQLPGGHSPFLTDPERLADLLLALPGTC